MVWGLYLLFGSLGSALAQRLVITADHTAGVYKTGEKVRWRVRWEGADAPAELEYIVKKGGLTEIGKGRLTLVNGEAEAESAFDAPGALLLEVRGRSSQRRDVRGVGGAVATIDKIQPSAKRPQDFDAFWKAQIEKLNTIPAEPRLEAGDSGKENISYWKIGMNNIRDTKIQGQLARPTVGEKLPALLIVQWAGVYGLQKSWVTDRAAEGWLVLNIEAHDLPIDKPEEFYRQQFAGPLNNYWAIGNEDRETSYFLRMYLSCYRAAQYLTEREDWDGRTLVVMGGSQGGQQTLVTAGLHPKITAALANVPAGCDMWGPEVGRTPGWPMWYYHTQNRDEKRVRDASRYFDVVNFASRIKCPILIGIGLLDETCPPSGILAAANQIRAPKELVLLPQGAHNDSNGTHSAYNTRCWSDWLPTLRQGKPAPVKK
jgi:cephalosporin-C deacetylase-like acetyl esterase